MKISTNKPTQVTYLFSAALTIFLLISGCKKQELVSEEDQLPSTSITVDKNTFTVHRDFANRKAMNKFLSRDIKLKDEAVFSASNIQSLKLSKISSLTGSRLSSTDNGNINNGYFWGFYNQIDWMFTFPNFTHTGDFPGKLWILGAPSSTVIGTLSFGQQILPGRETYIKDVTASYQPGWTIESFHLFNESISIAGVVFYERHWQGRAVITPTSIEGLVTAVLTYTELP